VDVVAPVDGRGLSAVQSEARQRIERLKFPLEYNAEVVKASEDVQAPSSRFLSLTIAALIGIFLLLQAAFGSWRLASMVFFTIPAALLGGLLVVLAGGGDFSLGAAVGVFAVGTIAVRNAILLITHLQELSARKGETLGLELVVRGVRERFAPIVMTAVATALALAPFAIAGDRHRRPRRPGHVDRAVPLRDPRPLPALRPQRARARGGPSTDSTTLPRPPSRSQRLGEKQRCSTTASG
jgi:multidrug efflux pump subunit AcrB